MKLMRYPFKRWRAWWLSMKFGSDTKVVCFTCGHCGEELRKYFSNVLVIGGEKGDFLPNRWFTDVEIADIFPDRLDLTSGNLSSYYIEELGCFYKNILGELDPNTTYYVPTGSGETILSLHAAYPKIKFVAVYNLDEATKYEPNAPLNDQVKQAVDILWEGKRYEFEN